MKAQGSHFKASDIKLHTGVNPVNGNFGVKCNFVIKLIAIPFKLGVPKAAVTVMTADKIIIKPVYN